MMFGAFLVVLASGQEKIGPQILDQWNKRLGSAKYMSGVLEVSGGEFTDAVIFSVEKPNKARIVGKKDQTFCDGLDLWYFLPTSKSYYRYAPSSSLPQISSFLLGVEALYGQSPDFAYASEKRTKFDGIDALAVTVNQLPNRVTMFGKFGMSAPQFCLTHYFDLSKKILLGTSLKLPMSDVTTRLTKLSFSKSKQVSYSWKPPKDAKLVATIDYQAQLLAVGSKVPDFSLPSTNGKEIRLSTFVKDKKATLLTFWFDGCAGCIIEYPHLDELYRKYKRRGLAVLGVNPIDSGETVRRYYKQGNFAFPAVISKDSKFDAASSYKVKAFPSNYLIGPDLVIIDRWVGEQSNLMKQRLARLGLK